MSGWTFNGVRVEVVPDDDTKAHPDIPKDVLAALPADAVLMSATGRMMYVRAGTWERMERRFNLETPAHRP